MTDPQVALLMLGVLLFAILLGFPIGFTLVAMGVGFGFYAYFRPAQGILDNNKSPGRRVGQPVHLEFLRHSEDLGRLLVGPEHQVPDG